MTMKTVSCRRCGAQAAVSISGDHESHEAEMGAFERCEAHEEAVRLNLPVPARCQHWRKSVEEAFDGS